MTTTATQTTTLNTTTPTADLAVIEKLALDKLAKSASKSDLDDLIKGARRSLLLVDVSGSMGDYIRSGGRKIDALREVVANLRKSHPVPVAAFGLDTRGGVAVVNEIPEPQGTTPLHTAISFGHSEGATHMVVVTDGFPDSPDACFNAARGFGQPIDVFYIGDGNDSGAQFCRELARLTGGTCSLTDLGKPKELAGKICLMLGDGN